MGEGKSKERIILVGTQVLDKLPPIKTLGERKVGESTTLLLYGDSGVGKTWLCGTLGERTLFCNIGNGIATIQSPLFTSKYPQASKMLCVDILEKAGKGGIITETTVLDSLTDTLDHTLISLLDRVDNVVIDDLSSLSRAASIRGLEVNKSTNKSKSMDSIKSEGTMLFAMQDYGAEMSIMKWFFATYIPLFKSAGKNLIVTALPLRIFKKGEKQSDPEILTSIMPAVTGKNTFALDFPGYFDDVWYMDVLGNPTGLQTRVQTRKDNVILAKTRHNGVFADKEINPDLGEMFGRIKSNTMRK